VTKLVTEVTKLVTHEESLTLRRALRRVASRVEGESRSDRARTAAEAWETIDNLSGETTETTVSIVRTDTGLASRGNLTWRRDGV